MRSSAKIVEELGWGSDKFISFINQESTKEALKLNTEELKRKEEALDRLQCLWIMKICFLGMID